MTKEWFKDIMAEQEQEKIKEEISQFNTKDLKKEIKNRENFIEVAKEEFSKRPDKPLKYIFGRQFNHFITWGIFVFIFAIFLFGAIPVYFNVNNEFINPSNSSLGLNASFENLKNAGIEATQKLMDIGARNPKRFFWLFWIITAYWIVFPIIEIIIDLIKRNKFQREMKGGKKTWWKN